MVTSFNDTIDDFESTGSKAYNLMKALNLGLKVPRYVCITPNDCINDVINPNTFKRLKRILQINFGEDTLYAVRPSASIYDENLFGQFESYLNVPLSRLDEYIDDCLASINSKRIQSYIKRHENLKNLAINVIVQEMVSTKMCGVMCTSNPIGIVSENMIVVGSNDCNDVLENKNLYNTYYYNTTDGKSYWVINSDNHVLKGDTLKTMYSILEKVKKFNTKPIRLDFSITDGEIYILQMENIPNFNLDNVITLCSGDMMLSYRHEYLPLNISFVKECYMSIFSNLIYHLTNSKDLVSKNMKVFEEVISIYNGRAYYNLDNIYQIFSMIPFSREPIPNSEDEPPLLDRICNSINMIKVLITSNHKMEDFQQDFLKAEKIFNDCYSEDLSNIQLRTLYKVIFSKTIEHWDINIINSVYCYINENSIMKLINKDVEISQNGEPILDVSTEDGFAGVVQQQILLGLSGNDIPKQVSLKLRDYFQKIFLSMGSNLVKLNYLENLEDVYYLTINELLTEQEHSYKSVVIQRKSSCEFYNRLPKYNQISFDGRVVNKPIILEDCEII